jgi:hypothetical protein
VPGPGYRYHLGMTDPSELPVSKVTPVEQVLPPPSVPAGWYPTPDGKQRYWDGTQWTNLPWNEAPDPAPAISVPIANTVPIAPPKRMSTGVRVGIIAGGSVVALVIIIIAAISVARGVVDTAAKAAKPTSFTARGSFDLIDNDDGGACDPPDGYSDLVAGSQVIITSGGKTLAVGELGAGHPESDNTTCHYTYSVKDVPLGYKFYGVEISHRGVIQESAADMEDGKIALSIGS